MADGSPLSSEALPDSETRIVISEDMLADLQKQIALRGGPGSVRLAGQIREYEKKNSKRNAQLTHSVIYSILTKRTQTMDVSQWKRLNEVVQSLPIFVLREKIDSTPQMLEELNAKILLHGDLRPKSLMRAINGYETEHNAPSVGLTAGILKWLLQGSLKTIHAARWERLNDVIDQLPINESKARSPNKIDLTEEMVDALKAKIAAKGGYGSIKLEQEVRNYETTHGKKGASLSKNIIHNIISRTNRTALSEQWERLNEVVEALPSNARKRIPLTQESLGELNAKIIAAGSLGYTRIMQEVERYEAVHQKESVGLTVKVIQKIIYRGLHTVDAAQWNRLIEVVENIPHAKDHPVLVASDKSNEPTSEPWLSDRIVITEEMRERLKADIATRGRYKTPSLLRTIIAYESERNWPSANIMEGDIYRITSGRARSVVLAHWVRLNEAIASLPVGITITRPMLEELKTLIRERGDLGYKALIKEIRSYEKKKNKDPIALQTSALRRILNGVTTFVESASWERFNEVVRALPPMAIQPRVTITPELLSELKSKIAARGDYAAKALLQQVKRYEQAYGKKSVQFTYQNIERILNGARKTVDEKQWIRLNEVVDSMAEVVGIRGRIHISEEMLDELKTKMAERRVANPVELVDVVTQYETAIKKPPCGFTYAIADAILRKRVTTADAARWHRINEALDALQQVTPRAKARTKMPNAATQRPRKLKNYNFSNTASEIADRILDRFIPALKEAVSPSVADPAEVGIAVAQKLMQHFMGDGFALNLTATEPASPPAPPADTNNSWTTLTAEMLDDFRNKVAAHGGYGSSSLMKAMIDYEKKEGKESTSLTEKIIDHLLYDRPITINTTGWERINEVVNWLPEIKARLRFPLMPETYQSFRERIANVGGFGYVHLTREVREYEAAHNLEDVGLTNHIIRGLFRGEVQSIDLDCWERLNKVIDQIDVSKIRQRLTLTPETYTSLREHLAAWPGYGYQRLAGAVRSHEITHNLSAVGLTKHVIRPLFDGTAKSIDLKYWNRLNDVLAAGPMAVAPIVTPPSTIEKAPLSEEGGQTVVSLPTTPLEEGITTTQTGHGTGREAIEDRSAETTTEKLVTRETDPDIADAPLEFDVGDQAQNDAEERQKATRSKRLNKVGEFPFALIQSEIIADGLISSLKKDEGEIQQQPRVAKTLAPPPPVEILSPELKDVFDHLALQIDRFAGAELEELSAIREKMWLTQMECMSSVSSALNTMQGHRRFLVTSVMGSGKTNIFLILCALSFQKLLDDRKKIVIVAPTNALVNQAYYRAKEIAPALWFNDANPAQDKIGRLNTFYKDYHRPIVITTPKSLQSALAAGRLRADEIRFLILDEAHTTAMSDMREQTIQGLKNTLIFAFTATPKYSERRSLDKHGYQEIYRLDVEEAVERKVIAPFAPIVVETNVADLSSVEMLSTGDYDPKSLARAINRVSRNMVGLNFYKDWTDPVTGISMFGSTAFINCLDIQHAENVVRLINEDVKKDPERWSTVLGSGKIAAAALHNRVPTAERDLILRAHQERKILIVAGVNMIVLGIDNVKASLTLNLAPTLSQVFAAQRGGRVLRTDAENSDKFSYVVDLVDMQGPKAKPVLFGEAVGIEPEPVHKWRQQRASTNTEQQPVAPAANGIDYSVISDPYVVHEIAEKFRLERAKATNRPPARTASDLVVNDVTRELRGIMESPPPHVHLYSHVRTLLKGLERNAADGYSEITAANEKTFQFICGYRASGGQRPFCLDRSELSKVLEYFDNEKAILSNETECLNLSEVKKRLRTRSSSVDELFNELHTQFKQTTHAKLLKTGITVLIKIRENDIFVVHESALEAIGRELGISPIDAPQDYLTQSEIAQATNVPEVGLKYLMEQLEEDFVVGRKTLPNSGQPLLAGYYRNKNGQTKFMVHVSHVDWIKDHAAQFTGVRRILSKDTQALESYPFLVDEVPKLLNGLKLAGISTKKELAWALLKEGATPADVAIGIQRFVLGQIFDRWSGGFDLTTISKQIAEIAGMSSSNAYTEQIKEAEAEGNLLTADASGENEQGLGYSSSELADLVRSEIFVRSRPSQPLEQVLFLKEQLPELLAALGKVNIRTKKDLTKALAEKGISESNISISIPRFFSGDVVSKRSRDGDRVISIAKAVAKIAGLAPNIVYAKQIKKAEQEAQEAGATGGAFGVRRGKPSQPLRNFTFLREKVPELLAALENAGISTRAELANAVIAKGMSQGNAAIVMPRFLRGDVINKLTGNPITIAQKAAEVADIDPSVAYAKQIENRKAVGASQTPQLQRLEECDFLSVQTPELLAALNQANILTIADLKSSLIEQEYNDHRVAGDLAKFLDGEVANRVKREFTPSAIAKLVAVIAGLSEEIAYKNHIVAHEKRIADAQVWANSVKAKRQERTSANSSETFGEAASFDRLEDETYRETAKAEALYATDLNQFDLLSREQEIALGMRMESARRKILEGFCKTPATLKIIRDLYGSVAEGTLQPSTVFELSLAERKNGKAITDEELDAGASDDEDHANATEENEEMVPEEFKANLQDRSQYIANACEELIKAYEEKVSNNIQRDELIELLLAMRPKDGKLEEWGSQFGQLAIVEGKILRHVREAGFTSQTFLPNYTGHELNGEWPQLIASKGRVSKEAMDALQTELTDACASMGLLTYDDHKRVTATVQSGKRELTHAKEEMITANLRLVPYMARRYLHRGMGLSDLIQEGNIGLMKGADRWDYRRGYKFATYSLWWIRQAITRSIHDQAQTIRIPVHLQEKISQLASLQHRYRLEKNRAPTLNEIAEELKVTTSQAKKLLDIPRANVSLDAPIGDDEDATIGNFIEDKKSVNALDTFASIELQERVAAVLTTLPEREAEVLRMRFGIGMDSDHTLEEVGQRYGLTRERIRQIEAKALGRLQKRTVRLREYVEGTPAANGTFNHNGIVDYTARRTSPALSSSGKEYKRRGPHTKLLRSFLIFSEEMPELLGALEAVNIHTRLELVERIVENGGNEITAHVNIKRLIDGHIVQQDGSFTAHAKLIAEIANIPPEFAYRRQIKSADGNSAYQAQRTPAFYSGEITTRSNPSDQSLKDSVFLYEKAPELLAALVQMKVHTRGDLIKLIVAMGYSHGAESDTDRLMRGFVTVANRGSIVTASASLIAQFAGLSEEAAYFRVAENFKNNMTESTRPEITDEEIGEAEILGQEISISQVSDSATANIPTTTDKPDGELLKAAYGRVRTQSSAPNPARKGKKGKPSELLENFSYLRDNFPDLLSALKNSGVHTRSDLVQCLMDKGLSKANAFNNLANFFDGSIVRKGRNDLTLTSIAKLVAEIAGLNADIAYARQIEEAKSSHTELPLPAVATEKDEYLSQTEVKFDEQPPVGKTPKAIESKRGRPSRSIESFKAFVESMPELFAALRQANIHTVEDLAKGLIARGIKESTASTSALGLLNGHVIDKRLSVPYVNHAANLTAAIAGLSNEIAYARQLGVARADIGEIGNRVPQVQPRNETEIQEEALQLRENAFLSEQLSGLLNKLEKAGVQTKLDLVYVLTKSGRFSRTKAQTAVSSFLSGEVIDKQRSSSARAGYALTLASKLIAKAAGLSAEVTYADQIKAIRRKQAYYRNASAETTVPEVETPLPARPKITTVRIVQAGQNLVARPSEPIQTTCTNLVEGLMKPEGSFGSAGMQPWVQEQFREMRRRHKRHAEEMDWTAIGTVSPLLREGNPGVVGPSLVQIVDFMLDQTSRRIGLPDKETFDKIIDTLRFVAGGNGVGVNPHAATSARASLESGIAQKLIKQAPSALKRPGTDFDFVFSQTAAAILNSSPKNAEDVTRTCQQIASMCEQMLRKANDQRVGFVRRRTQWLREHAVTSSQYIQEDAFNFLVRIKLTRRHGGVAKGIIEAIAAMAEANPSLLGDGRLALTRLQSLPPRYRKNPDTAVLIDDCIGRWTELTGYREAPDYTQLAQKPADSEEALIDNEKAVSADEEVSTDNRKDKSNFILACKEADDCGLRQREAAISTLGVIRKMADQYPVYDSLNGIHILSSMLTEIDAYDFGGHEIIATFKTLTIRALPVARQFNRRWKIYTERLQDAAGGEKAASDPQIAKSAKDLLEHIEAYFHERRPAPPSGFKEASSVEEDVTDASREVTTPKERAKPAHAPLVIQGISSMNDLRRYCMQVGDWCSDEHFKDHKQPIMAALEGIWTSMPKLEGQLDVACLTPLLHCLTNRELLRERNPFEITNGILRTIRTMVRYDRTLVVRMPDEVKRATVVYAAAENGIGKNASLLEKVRKIKHDWEVIEQTMELQKIPNEPSPGEATRTGEEFGPDFKPRSSVYDWASLAKNPAKHKNG